jgi:hypothetical protein
MNASNTLKIMTLSAAVTVACSVASANTFNEAYSPYVVSPSWSSSPEAAVFQLKYAEQSANQQGFSIEYLGSDEFTDKFGSLSSNTSNGKKLNNKRIVIVQSDTSDRDSVLKLLAQGSYVISVGGAKVDTVKSAMAMLGDIAANGASAADKKSYDTNQSQVFGEDANGNEVEGKVAAYFFSPSGSKDYATTEQNIGRALAQAIEWVIQEDLNAQSQDKAQAKAFVSERKIDVNCTADMSVYGGGKAEEVGYVHTKMIFTKGTGNYWEVKYSSEMAKKGNWRMSYLITNSLVRSKHSGFSVLTYQPSSSLSGGTATVGLSGGGIEASWSYNIADMTEKFSGSRTTGQLQWEHDINQNTSAGSNTHLIQPGAIIKTDKPYADVRLEVPLQIIGTWVQLRGAINESCKARVQ